MRRILVSFLTFAAALPAFAAAPRQMLSTYSAEAARERRGFSPSGERDRQFYLEKRSAAEKMPNCATCHIEDPTAAGKHVIAGKAIEPIAPVADSARFTDAAKTEKWFRRNCKDVLSRACSAEEKGDVLAYLLTVRP